MSYSSQTKEELCRFEPDSVCCLLAELSGIVCAAGSVIYRGGGDKRLSIETENNAVARRAFRLLREVFDVQPQLVTLKRSRLGGRSAYRIEISGSEASFVLEGCGIEMGQRRGVPRELWEDALSQSPDAQEAIARVIAQKTRGRALDEKGRKRLSDMLLRRGFAWRDVRAALAKIGEDTTEFDYEE